MIVVKDLLMQGTHVPLRPAVSEACQSPDVSHCREIVKAPVFLLVLQLGQVPTCGHSPFVYKESFQKKKNSGSSNNVRPVTSTLLPVMKRRAIWLYPLTVFR